MCAVSRLEEQLDALETFYGPLSRPPQDPFILFVWEVLSVHSTPRRRDAALAALRWHDHPAHDEFAVRILGIDAYSVDERFPRLTASCVPAGVLDASYTAALPAQHADWWGEHV